MIQRFLFLCTLVCSFVGVVRAQEAQSDSVESSKPNQQRTEWSVNVIGSYGLHDVDFNALPPVENCCLGFESSTGVGYGLQIGASFPLANNGLRLSTRLGYQALPVSYSSFSTNPVYVQGVGTVNAVFEHALDIAFHTVPLHVSLEYPIADWLLLGIGPDAYYVASSSFKQMETLQEPADLNFETGGKTRIDTTSSLSNYNSMVFNAHGSLRVRLGKNLGSIVGLDLLVNYSLPITALFDPQTWQGTASGGSARSYYINRYNLSLLTAGIALAF